jgi:hypothetical protein
MVVKLGGDPRRVEVVDMTEPTNQVSLRRMEVVSTTAPPSYVSPSCAGDESSCKKKGRAAQ